MRGSFIFITVFCAINAQQLPGVDIPGAVLQQVSTLTQQLNGFQRVLSELNSQFSRMVETGTKMVTGGGSRYKRQSVPGVDIPGAMLQQVSTLTQQLNGFQRVLTELNSQFSRMVETGTKMVTGGGYRYKRQSIPGVDLPGAVLSQVSTLTRQVDGIQSILSQLNSQVSRMIATSTKMITGGAGFNRLKRQSEAVDIPGSFINQINAMTRQLTAMQGVLTELNQQFSRMVETGTKMITGGGSRFKRQSNGVNIPETFLSQVNVLTKQITQIQGVLSDLNTQFSRMVETSSKMITGGGSYQRDSTTNTQTQPTSTGSGSNTGTGSGTGTTTSTSAVTSTDTHGMSGTGSDSGTPKQPAPTSGATQSVSEVALKTLGTINEQFGSAQKIASELTQQFSKIFATGAKVITGNRDVSPAEAALNSLTQFTQQFREFQDVLRNLNQQFNRMVTTGSKMIGGDGTRYKRQVQPGAAVFEAVQQATQQIAAAQRVLSELNSQFNRMLETGTRMITGGGSFEGRADQQVISGLQRATAELTRQLGSLGGTLARIAAGATGVRVLGGEDGTRGLGDTFGSLNPMAALGRGVGNIAGSLSKMVPNSG